MQFNGVSFEVVGLLTAKGSQGPQDRDDVVIAPLTSVQDTLASYGTLTSIAAQATAADKVDAAQDEVSAILTARHHVTRAHRRFHDLQPELDPGRPSTRSPAPSPCCSGRSPAISLFVGGIGVMNIMLVTVTERTREIGIRKAIGAQRSDIVGQFLLEAVLLSLAGGLDRRGDRRARRLREDRHLPAGRRAYSIVLAFVVSVAIGLFFGWYPANRAASLRPIDALRYE